MLSESRPIFDALIVGLRNSTVSGLIEGLYCWGSGSRPSVDALVVDLPLLLW